MWNLVFLFSGLFLNILLLIVFNSKEKVYFVENKIFLLVTIINFFGFLVEIFSQILIMNLGKESILVMLFGKFYLIYLLIWMGCFSIYVYLVTNKKGVSFQKERYKTIKLVHIIYIFITSVIAFLLPMLNFYENGSMYSYGVAINFTKIILLVYILIWIFRLILNYKMLMHKSFIPIFTIILLLIANVILQSIYPTILIATFTMMVTCYVLFFTIENPDLKLLRQMELAKLEAEKANKAKSEFLSSMSHEIRTPLNAVMGFGQLGEITDNLDEAREYFSDIMKASNILLELVNSILDVSKIESGNMEIINRPYKIREVIKEVEVLVKQRAEAKELKFTVFIADDVPNDLSGDASSVKKIIVNLLTNAIKYTREGFVKMEINCVIKNDICRLIISVEDSGKGIKTEDISKLFANFVRLEEDRNTSTEGTGLGLAIVKHLTNLMGGNISVHSVFGQGSKFIVTINQNIKEGLEEEVKEAKELDFSGKEVLIVDDNLINRKVGTRFLEQYNCHVTSVVNAYQAFDLIDQGNKYNLIFIDEMMPKMSGTEVMKTLKDRGYKVPIVVWTANEMAGQREDFMKVGFDEFLGKPLKKEELELVLIKYLT